MQIISLTFLTQRHTELHFFPQRSVFTKGYDTSLSLNNTQLLNPTPFKHTDKEDMFSKIQYTIAVLSNKVSQGTQIIL